ncbi:MAG: BTAD domain-containing putative transcriptional regulator [Actinomycetota bacterium]
MVAVGRAARHHVTLEGPIHVGRSDGSMAPVPPSLQPLVALLCLAPDKARARASVLASLWPDVPESKARARLSTNLWRLRTLLESTKDGVGGDSDDDGDHGGVESSSPVTGDDLLRQPPPCPEADEWRLLRTVDLDAIDWNDPATTELRQRVEHVALRNPQDLAQGCDHDWVVDQRTQLELAAQRALGHLIEVNAELGHLDRAILLAEVLTDRDQLREDGHRWLMRLYARAGRRVDALRRFDHCVAVLDADLGVSPMDATIELADLIRSGQPMSSPPDLPTTETIAPGPTPGIVVEGELGFSLALGAETATILDALDRARRALAEVEAALRLQGDPTAQTSPHHLTG